MRIVTMTRKPCSEGTATANVVEHHAGAINIDGCRVAGAPWRWGTQTDLRGAGYGSRRPSDGSVFARNVESDPAGRWPANVLLMHRPGCEQTGTTVVPGYTINRWADGAKPFGGGAGHEYESERQADESVAVWECEDDCAVKGLGEQSGECPPGFSNGQAPKGEPGVTTPLRRGTLIPRTDAGTAARFFKQVQVPGNCSKQVQETTMDEIPDELWDYLTTLISPPVDCEPLLIVDDDLDGVDWAAYEDQSVHGMITVGNPEPHMKEIDRVLRPGAHLLLIAPDEERTGHTGACAVEDHGFEIRDAIMLLDEPDDFHYVAKASTAERNAGVPEFTRTIEVTRLFPAEGVDVEELAEEMAEFLEEEMAPTWVEEGLAPHVVPGVLRDRFVERQVEVQKVHRNDHPTCKPIRLMERLLADVPKDALVVDPFVGSGTTGIACLRTGHDFVGIEQDGDYLKIADQRVRHWDRAVAAWDGAEIESEAEIEEDELIGLGDLFGLEAEEDPTPIGDCRVCGERDEEVEIKEQGERFEVCSQCDADRPRVRKYLLARARARVQELE